MQPPLIQLLSEELRDDDGDYLSLNEVYDGDWPDENEKIWNFVGPDDFDTKFKVVTINPVEWFKNYKPDGTISLEQTYKRFAHKDQKKYVKRLMTMWNDIYTQSYVVIDDTELVDGFHRVVAFALLGNTELKAVDLSEPMDI